MTPYEMQYVFGVMVILIVAAVGYLSIRSIRNAATPEMPYNAEMRNGYGAIPGGNVQDGDKAAVPALHVAPAVIPGENTQDPVPSDAPVPTIPGGNVQDGDKAAVPALHVAPAVIPGENVQDGEKATPQTAKVKTGKRAKGKQAEKQEERADKNGQINFMKRRAGGACIKMIFSLVTGLRVFSRV